MLTKKRLTKHSNITYKALEKKDYRAYMLDLMYKKKEGTHYKRLTKSAINGMISMYMKEVSKELLKGNIVGSSSFFIRINQIEGLDLNLYGSNFSRRKRNLSNFKLGPLDKKLFIKITSKKGSTLQQARAIGSFRKKMYHLACSGKQMTKLC